jgi:hypothetical protein
MTTSLQHPTISTIQNRAAALTALFMTVFLLCIEHVRAFANQYHLSAHDAMVLASAASSLSRRLGESVRAQRSVRKEVSLSSSRVHHRSSEESSTKLQMAWSIPAITLPTMPTLTSKDLPVHALGSWYTKVDPTNTLPVYDDEYENTYSYTTDDWPSVSSDSSSQPQATTVQRRRPFKAIRRVAGRFVDHVARFPHSQ